MRRLALLLGSALLLACASAPRPRIMFDVDAASSGAQAAESKQLAPQAHAAAEALRARAEDAHREGDTASAQIASEHALAAYSRAFVLARLARAERELAGANRDLAQAKSTLADIDEKHRRVAAEASDLELRIRVAEDALPLVPNAPAGPEREKARLDAARALASQARLLCVATRLLDPKLAAVGAELDKLAQLDRALASSPKAAPIDAAVAARSSCLRLLTEARRPAASAAPAAGVTDALLAELSRVGSLHPFRDDRGVVITLRGVFDAKGALGAEGKRVLESLGRVAKAHPSFPLLVVFHGRGSDEARKKAIADALGSAGASRVDGASAGSAEPVVDPARPGSRPRNERIEIVFVAPTH